MKFNLVFAFLIIQSSILFSQTYWMNFTGQNGVRTTQLVGDTLWIGFAGGISIVDANTGETIHNFNAANSGIEGNYVEEMVVGQDGKAWFTGFENDSYETTALSRNLQYFDGTAFIEAANNIEALEDSIKIRNLVIDDNNNVYFMELSVDFGYRLWLLANEQLTEIPLPDGYSELFHLFIDHDNHLHGYLDDTFFGEWDGTSWQIHDIVDVIEISGISTIRDYEMGPDNMMYALVYAGAKNRVMKFNGTEWESISNNISSAFWGISFDTEGNPWLESNNGTSRYPDWDNSDRYYIFPELPFGQYYRGYIRTENDEFWVKTGGTVYKISEPLPSLSSPNYYYFENNVFIKPGNSPLLTNSISNISIDVNQNKIIGNSYRNFLKFDGTHWDTIALGLFPTSTSYSTVISDNETGYSYIYNDFVVNRFDGNSIEEFDLTNGGMGVSFIGTEDEFIFNTNEFIGHYAMFDQDNNYSESTIPKINTTLFQYNSEDVLHVFNKASNIERVYYYDGSTWNQYPMGIYVGGSSNIELFVDRDDNIWLANAQGKLRKYDPVADTLVNLLIGGNAARSANKIKIEQDSEGNYWFMNHDGLHKYDGIDWSLYSIYNSGLSGGRYNDFTIDVYDNLWIATDNGLCVFNEDGIESLGGDPVYRIEGNVYYDVNNDLEYTPDVDAPFPWHRTTIDPQDSKIYTNQKGRFGENVLEGDYTVRINEKADWEPADGEYTLSVPVAGDDYLNADFRMIPTTVYDSVEVFIVGEPARCGEFITYTASFRNTGTTLLSGRFVITPDSLMTIISSEPALTYEPNEDYYYLDFENHLPFELTQVRIDTRAPSLIYIGTLLDWKAEVLKSENTTFASLDSTHFDQIVACSYDPNDKLVQVDGPSINELSLIEDALFYTIRFQNTGNAEAYRVEVIDTIDTNLDMSTLSILQSSHDMETYLEEDNIIHFVFNNINLPDSTSNERESHGFIQYSIKSHIDLPEPIDITNTAYIYFDSNPAIQTNTVQNKLVTMFPTTAVTSIEKGFDIQVSPNPTDGLINISHNDYEQLIITDGLGRTLLRNDQAPLNVDVSDFPAGIYFLHFYSKHQKYSLPIIKK